jgi:hypothetical protein
VTDERLPRIDELMRRTQAAMGERDPATPFTQSRYPFTYAYDYIRDHAEAFELPAELCGSRSGVAGWVRRLLWDTDRISELTPAQETLTATLLVVLADQYCLEWGIQMPADRMERASL